MKRKGILALALAASMVTGMLSGCGSTKENTSETNEASGEAVITEAASTEAASTEAPSSEEASTERLTISVMGVDWGYGPVADSEMEIYWEDLFDVNLEIEWVNYEDYTQKLNTLIASGSQPDVVQMYSVNGSYYYPIFTQAIDAGEFVDMTSYLFEGENAIATNNTVMKNWSESFWAETTYNNGIYILPRSKSEPAKNSGIMVRKDLMEKYGYQEEPTNMEELKEWMIGLSNAATEGEGYKLYGLEWFGENFMDDKIKGFAVAFTGQSDWGINEAGEYQYMQFDENYIDFLSWTKDLYDAGVLDSEFALGNADTSKFKAGNSVAFLNAWYNFNQSADKTSNKIFDSNTPDTYTTWELMPVEGPKAYTVSPNSTDVDSCIAISAQSSEEKIQKILEVFNHTEEDTPGYDVLMSDGVEGVHYKLLADGTRDSSDTEMGAKRTEGYVGAWNQIFLKIDADQITSKFMRDGAKRSSDEHIEKVTEVKEFIVNYLAETGLKNEVLNLSSETYNSQWTILTDDVNTMCTQYVMGQITEEDWTKFIDGIVNSEDYKKIQSEFKASAEK